MPCSLIITPINYFTTTIISLTTTSTKYTLLQPPHYPPPNRLDTKVSVLSARITSTKGASGEHALLKEMQAQLVFYAGLVILNKSVKVAGLIVVVVLCCVGL